MDNCSCWHQQQHGLTSWFYNLQVMISTIKQKFPNMSIFNHIWLLWCWASLGTQPQQEFSTHYANKTTRVLSTSHSSLWCLGLLRKDYGGQIHTKISTSILAKNTKHHIGTQQDSVTIRQHEPAKTNKKPWHTWEQPPLYPPKPHHLSPNQLQFLNPLPMTSCSHLFPLGNHNQPG